MVTCLYCKVIDFRAQLVQLCTEGHLAARTVTSSSIWHG